MEKNTLISNAVVGCLSVLAAATCQASPIQFPSGYVPFASIYSQSMPDSGGYSFVEGVTDGSASHNLGVLYQYLYSLPMPSAHQQYASSSIELAPGQFFFNVLVPTPDEIGGDFQSWDIPVIDPYTNAPFPGNIIPMPLFGTPYVFVAGPATAVTDTPEPSALLLFGLGLAGLAVKYRAK